MKPFDVNVEYTDEEWKQFATEAFKIDDEMRKNLEKFVNFTIGNPVGNMKYIPDEDIAFINRDPKLTKDLYSLYYGTENIDREKQQLIASGFTPVITTKLPGTERATEVPLIHDLIGMEAKAKIDLMTGPIALDPKLVEQSTPYIFNLFHMTKDDHLIISRRAITCSIARPFTKDLGNGYCEQTWLGDITKWPAYVEYDEEFK